MTAILQHHNEYITIPALDDEAMEWAREFIQSRSCPAWQNGIFAADGSMFPLFEKPGFYGETFYD
jgi:hypothetical protein